MASSATSQNARSRAAELSRGVFRFRSTDLVISRHSVEKKPRIALFDNIKGIAILLVVLGHFCARIVGFTDSHLIYTTLTFIYFFHMPLFLFCSGLFAGKSWYKRHQAPSDKVLLYMILYLIFLGLIVVLDLVVFHKTPGVNPFVVTGAPWFMLVLGLFMLMVPIMGSVRPASFLAVSILLAVGSGVFLTEVGTLSVSRFFVYLPYFALGFYLQPESVEKLVDVVEARIGTIARIVLAAVMLAAIFAALYLLFTNTQLTFIKRISTGMNLLSVLSVRWHVDLWILALLRIVQYAAVFVMGALVVLLCPKHKCFLTFMGERSFQVYIFHILIMYCISYYNWYEPLVAANRLWILSPYVFAPILTALLAWPKGPNNLVKDISDWTKSVTAPKENPLVHR